MSGVTLLVANTNVQNALICAYARSEFSTNTYWIITVRVPKNLKDNLRLAIKSVSNSKLREKRVKIK